MAMDVTVVQEGEQFIYQYDGHTRFCVTKAKCDQDAGAWFCAVHGYGFANNMMWWNHCEESGEHRAVWMCLEHGPEVP